MAQDTALKIDNRYEVLGELGRGGMGIVYKANDLKMDRLVAIKVMTSHGVGRDEYQERFLREARSIAKMQHPNIVVVHDYGYHDGNPYMAMEYVEGIPLDKVIASRVNITPLAKVDYIVQVCHALHYAHQQGIVHRDVKPGNIMLLEGGKRVKLLDFGIARAGGASNLSKSGLAMGTTCYMSPEQTKGQRNMDGRADIFSAGVVLYELLAGKPPWTGDSDYEVMTKIIHDPFPPLSGVNNYPQVLDHIFERALAKDPSARYQTAEEMARELSELEGPLKEQALEEALVQFESGDLLRARDLVSQILRIDTRHREAIELQGKLQQVAQLQQRSDQVRQLRTAAEQAIGEKRYTEALSAVEQAISIDSANTELFHYRELIRHEVKRREDIRKKLELAQRAQEINDLSTAQELVDKALEADPTDTQARMMKSRLEQERKRQQQQEMAEEASRALAVRAFARAREFIQQLEALDPAFAPLASLKQALQEGEAEEKRRVEIENVIRDIRRVLESGDVAQSLAVTEQALARFPAEPRLVRLRAQAEALRDAAERERAIQEKIALVKKLTEKGQHAEALVTAESAVIRLGADHRLQALLPQLRQAVERERQLQAQQAVLTQARNAIQAEDFEFALKILAAARVDFPDSREIVDALQAAQEANARKLEAVERERQLQTEQAILAQARKAMKAADFDSAVKILAAARFDFPQSKDITDALQAARAGAAKKADAVERERKAQAEQAALAQARKAMQVSDFEAALKIVTAAQINFPNSKDLADALQAAQTAIAKKAEAAERERKLQAEKAALAQARNAMQAADFETTLKILTAARIDSPNSKELADALQAAQAAIARKAELNAEKARKREIAEALDRALVSEPDPELQVRLAEEAVRRIPGNEAAERVLIRVRERQQQITSAVDRAWKFEQAQGYAKAIQEWERVRQLWPQNPQIATQITRLKALLEAPARAPEPVAPPSPVRDFSATSIMAAAPRMAPAPPPPVQAAPGPVERAQQPAAPPEGIRETSPAPSDSLLPAEAEAERTSLKRTDLLQSKKLLFGIAGAVVVVIVIAVLAVVLNRKSAPTSTVANAPTPTPTTIPKPAPIQPAVGTLTVRANVDQFDVFVDGAPKPAQQQGRREQTITVASGHHTISVAKSGYEAPPQPVDIQTGGLSKLQFAMNLSTTTQPVETYLIITALPGAKVRIDRKDAGQAEADGNFSLKVTPDKNHRIEVSLEGYHSWTGNASVKVGEKTTVKANLAPIPKLAPMIASFSASPTSIQQGQSVQLQWEAQNATDVRIDPDIGTVQAKGSTFVTLNESKTYTLKASGEGNPAQRNLTINVAAAAKPVITSFEAGAKRIPQGESVKLIWNSQNATEGSISPEVGKVPAQGSIDVTPTKNTAYILTVKGPGGTSEQRTVQILVESAPTPAPVPAAAPVSTASAEDSDVKAVKDAIHVRYKNALEIRSLSQVKTVYPHMPKYVEDALKSTFNVPGVKAERFDFANCDQPTISGDSAEYKCVETVTYNRDNNVDSTKPFAIIFHLKKTGGTWYIESFRGEGK